MLSAEEKQRILSVCQRHRHGRAACLEALTIVQESQRYVSDDCLRELADMLQMTPTELDSVATFYSYIFRRPVGRHVILVCDSISCWICGYARVLDRLEKKLGVGPGETTPDGRFTLLTEPCLGVCDRAPAVMIDDDLYGNLTGDDLDVILERYG